MLAVGNKHCQHEHCLHVCGDVNQISRCSLCPGSGLLFWRRGCIGDALLLHHFTVRRYHCCSGTCRIPVCGRVPAPQHRQRSGSAPDVPKSTPRASLPCEWQTWSCACLCRRARLGQQKPLWVTPQLLGTGRCCSICIARPFPGVQGNPGLIRGREMRSVMPRSSSGRSLSPGELTAASCQLGKLALSYRTPQQRPMLPTAQLQQKSPS